jgi:hypothetical protein
MERCGELNSEEYSFPAVFIKGYKTNKTIIRNGDCFIETSNVNNTSEYYGMVSAEEAIEELIDLEAPVIKESFIIIPSYTSQKEKLKGLLVEKGVKPCIIEIRGKTPYVTTREGEQIEENKPIGFIITGKGETKNILSPCRGRIVLIANYSWEEPEKYVIIVVDNNDAREVVIRKDTGRSI